MKLSNQFLSGVSYNQEPTLQRDQKQADSDTDTVSVSSSPEMTSHRKNNRVNANADFESFDSNNAMDFSHLASQETSILKKNRTNPNVEFKSFDPFKKMKGDEGASLTTTKSKYHIAYQESVLENNNFGNRVFTYRWSYRRAVLGEEPTDLQSLPDDVAEMLQLQDRLIDQEEEIRQQQLLLHITVRQFEALKLLYQDRVNSNCAS